MRSLGRSSAILTLTLATVVPISSCTSTFDRPDDLVVGNGDSGNGSWAALEGNASTVAAAIGMVETMAAEGSDSASIQAGLLAQLLQDPRVAGAAVDPANNVVYADFINGETQSWMVIDETTDPDALLPDDSDPVMSPKASVDRSSGDRTPPRELGTGTEVGDRAARQLIADQSFWILPGNRQALVANGLTFFESHWPLNDSTALVADMLEARGYQVTAEQLSVDHFRHLSDYGVILLEAHGLWRDSDFWSDLINRDPFTNELETANCGGDWSLTSVLTTTEATAANREANRDDIRCGRLLLRNVTRDWNNDGTKTTRQFYEVTPNYIAQYDEGTFPDYTLMVLNACRGYRADLLSPFQRILAAKCDRGSYFLGWTNGLRYFYAARAALNLFQLMTVSNQELIVNGVTVLAKATPPRGGQFVGLNSGAYTQLDNRSYTIARRGAYFLRTGQTPEIRETILAPQPNNWLARDAQVTSGIGSKPRLSMISDAAPAVTIGGNSVAATPLFLCCSPEWDVTGSDAVFGNIIVSQDGRSGFPLTLHRWKPQIRLTGTNGGLSYTATFTLQARATIGFASMRVAAWDDAPAAQFDRTPWDLQGSALSWTVSGDETIDNKRYHYEGSGLRSFTSDDGGWIESDSSGMSVSLDVYGTARYTTTITDLTDQSVETVITDQVVSLSRSGTNLSPIWTVAADTFDDDGGFGGTGQVTWNAFAADPPFEPAEEPR